VVLRTLLTWETNQDYRYNAQPARNYQRWLAVPGSASIYDVVRRKASSTPAVNFFETTELPDEPCASARSGAPRGRGRAEAAGPARRG
jgi:hypothetical protein